MWMIESLMRRTASTSSSCVGARSTLTRSPRRRGAFAATERLDQFAEQVGGLVDVGDAFRPHALPSPSSSASQSMPPLKFDCHERREVMMRRPRTDSTPTGKQ